MGNTFSTTCYAGYRMMGKIKGVKRFGRPCKYSPSCFECPLSDCLIGGLDACVVNKLPGEEESNRYVKGLQSKEKLERKIKRSEKEVAERRGRHTTNNK